VSVRITQDSSVVTWLGGDLGVLTCHDGLRVCRAYCPYLCA
jgi:hypothetical protein